PTSWPRWRCGRPPRLPVIGPSCRSSRPTRLGAPSAPARATVRPGPARCPRGAGCFAEAARARAAEADVVVVNLHLYGLDLAADGALLPDHEVAVVDGAPPLDDIIPTTTEVELGPGRFTQLGRVLRGILAGADDTVAAVADAAGILIDALVAHRD